MKDLAAVEEAVGLGAKIEKARLPYDQVVVSSRSLWMASIVLADSRFLSSS